MDEGNIELGRDYQSRPKQIYQGQVITGGGGCGGGDNG
jgi:hypothetical protein